MIASSLLPTPDSPLAGVHAALLRRAQDPAFRALDARRERLRRLADAVRARRSALTRALTLDLGKSRAEGEAAELHPVRQEIKFVLRHLARWARPVRVKTPLTLLGTRSEVRSEPKGAVLILSPWNYPVNLALMPLVGALAAGNTALVKPSEKAPHTAEALRALIEATFAPDEVSLVTGGPHTARELLDLPWDHIFFTGSGAIGREVMMAAARHLTPVTLELGGKSPAIVDASADLPQAAERIAWGKLMNAGQTCVAPDYVLVQQDVEQELLGALKASIERFYGGPVWQRLGSDYGRLVDEAAARRMAALLDDARLHGARVVTGGVVDPAGRFAAPTILSGVSPEMRLLQEEIFGPLLPVVPYRDTAEALAFVRRLGKPLALYAFGRNKGFVDQVGAHSTSGGLVENGVMIHLLNAHLPFGGVGESGQGAYHGEHGFRTFSHTRAVLHEPRLSPIRFAYPPYGRAAPRLLNWLLRHLS